MKIYYNKQLKYLARKLRNDPTLAEARLWGCLRGKNLMGYKFTRQKPLDNFIVDFFCHQLRLVIELDGLSHEFEEVLEKDDQKERRLCELGLHVMRFDDAEVMKDIDNVLSEIEGFIEEFENQSE